MELPSDYYLLAFAASFFIAAILTPLMRTLALRTGIVDRPNQDHKTHMESVPYLGGLAIVSATIVVTYGSLILLRVSIEILILASTILVPAMLMATIGLVDDIKQLKPWPRFVMQNLVASVSVVILVMTDTVGSPVNIFAIDVAISLIWLVGITNAINFFDNIDGGASGTIAVSSLALTFMAISSQQFLIAAMASVLAGSVIGFLLWNRPPARIYMGDAGALFLGILIASLSIRIDTNALMGKFGLLIPILLLAIPILDTSVAISKRIMRKVSPFQGGRDHLSHRLIRLGLDRRATVIVLWILTFFFACAAVFAYLYFAHSGIEILFVCVLTWVLLFIFFMLQKDS